jgi:hypothetical protein
MQGGPRPQGNGNFANNGGNGNFASNGGASGGYTNGGDTGTSTPHDSSHDPDSSGNV